MKKVSVHDINNSLQEYVAKWSNSSENTENYYVEKYYYRNIKIIKIDPWDLIYVYDDIELLKRIDNMKLSDVHKLLFYLLFDSNICTEAELVKFLNRYSISDIKNIHRYNIFNQMIIELLEWKTGKNNFSIRSHTSSFYNTVFEILSCPKPKTETLKSLYLTNIFLTNANNEETFEEYYANNIPETIIKNDGTMDLSLFKNSGYINKLLPIFLNGYAGAMGETVNKGVTNKLMTIPKETYLKLLELPANKCKTIQALETVNNEERVRNFNKNINILLEIIFEKIIEDTSSDIRSMLAPIYSMFNYSIYGKENVLLDKITTEITDLIVENKDELYCSEVIAILLTFYDRKFWVRTGKELDTLSLLLSLCKEDVKGTVKLLQYLAFTNELEPPTITQWKSVSGSDLFEIQPSLAIILINNTEKTRVNGNLSPIRNAYKKGWIK